MIRTLRVILLIIATSVEAFAQTTPQQLRWAGDPEGGAPYVEASPTNPGVLVGFDVEIAGHRVATLGGTIAYEILRRAQREHGITAVSYDDDVHPFSDLVLGRVDAVLIDNVIAERRTRTVSGFSVQPVSAAESHYVGLFARSNSALRDRADEILRSAMRDGTL